MKKESAARLYMNNSMKAVHDDDVEHLLRSLNVFEAVTQGQCKCIYCEQIVSLDNLAAIVPEKNQIHFICNADECYSKLFLDGEKENA